ncbi:DnaJ domain [Macleaya cordata]|uniref:DnaJ domain n=1 Tax=Macleaya cordata TaxID=56857 RepID=A0A200QB67_MACCD|nr:DnaJ domain [Macleaya cordata]
MPHLAFILIRPTVVSEAAHTLKGEAELKFKAQDFTSALKFAKLAKDLDPNLEGVEQFIAAYRVYVAAAAPSAYFDLPTRMFNGEPNWYDILGLTDIWIETEVIRKQYKKMEELVHPDKNNSIAAEGAFKLISEAWRFLSNPYRRLAYNVGLDPDFQ